MTTAPANFYKRVDRALKDPAMRAAMKRATARLVSSRDVGFGGFPQADQIRDHARAIRAHTITRLDYYLARFEEAVRARGGHVHWAATASDAV